MNTNTDNTINNNNKILYHPCFCEENIYNLLKLFYKNYNINILNYYNTKFYSLIITTSNRKCYLLNQRLAKDNDYICWDYHVILLVKNLPIKIKKNEKEKINNINYSLISTSIVRNNEYNITDLPIVFNINDIKNKKERMKINDIINKKKQNNKNNLEELIDHINLNTNGNNNDEKEEDNKKDDDDDDNDEEIILKDLIFDFDTTLGFGINDIYYINKCFPYLINNTVIHEVNP